MVFKQFSVGEGIEIRWFGSIMGYHFPGKWWVEDFSLDQMEEPKLKKKIKSANSISPDTQFDDKESIDGWKIVSVG